MKEANTENISMKKEIKEECKAKGKKENNGEDLKGRSQRISSQCRDQE